jgi:hypothetical protein
VWTKLDLPADYTTALGAATHVNTNGNGLTFVNEFGSPSAGVWINPTQLTAFGLIATVGQGKLTWSDGTVWYENVSLNGSGSVNVSARPSQFTVVDYVNLFGLPVHLIETGTTQAVFVDSRGRMTLGSFFSPDQATTDLYPGDVATVVGDVVVWQDGTVWLKSAVPSSQITLTDYTNPIGLATHTVTNGTANVAFSDSLGRLFLGTLTNATQAITSFYRGDVATFTPTTVNWQDGTVWNKTSAPPGTILATDANSSRSHLKLLEGFNTLIGLDGPLQGVTGNRRDDTIIWSNGEIWNGFDVNALNAFYEMQAGLPRYGFPG